MSWDPQVGHDALGSCHIFILEGPTVSVQEQQARVCLLPLLLHVC